MKRMLVLFLLAILLPSRPVFADFVISEVMYDLKTGSDEGREWVEVYNNAEAPADFSTFKFFEADTNHKLILFEGSAIIPAHGYAVIVSDPAKWKIDWPNFSGSIFDSTFSLSNTGEALAIKNGDEVVDQYFYHSNSGGAGDGNSLQKINGAWLATLPTPGAENKITFVPPPPKKNNPVLPQNIISQQKPEEISLPVQNEAPDITTVGDIPEKSSGDFYIFASLLLILTGAGVGAVYFIRRRKNITEDAENFEILDD